VSSDLEAAFDYYWRILDGPELEAEYRFAPPRRWRADRAHVGAKVLIEIEGGMFSLVVGRHTRGAGYQKDCEKYNRAAALGWVVFRLATGMVEPEHIEPIIQYIRERQ
jgi:hypothetical protein